ncbi:MAG: GFA family protein [Alphaproteobacteria bacterium]|nr:GFA family protein [Alphaproteobacteria bacterium]MBL7096532.1 GFA family protein [Alphaproteobacteria bacterium]
MPKTLEGSCRCGAVSFTVESSGPYPYQLCYCSICRKTDGGGGFAINLIGDKRTLKAKGSRAIRMFHAEIRDEDGRCHVSTCERRFCGKCGTPLWVYEPDWPDLTHPFASCIDTPLPKPPSKVHLMLKYKAPWVVPDIGPGDRKFQLYPKQSIEEWHRARGLWLD